VYSIVIFFCWINITHLWCLLYFLGVLVIYFSGRYIFAWKTIYLVVLFISMIRIKDVVVNFTWFHCFCLYYSVSLHIFQIKLSNSQHSYIAQFKEVFLVVDWIYKNAAMSWYRNREKQIGEMSRLDCYLQKYWNELLESSSLCMSSLSQYLIRQSRTNDERKAKIAREQRCS